MELNTAFAPLRDEELNAAHEQQGSARLSRDEWMPVLPVPDDVANPSKDLASRLAPAGHSFTKAWAYRNRAGGRNGFVLRYDRPANGAAADKQVLPLTWCEGPNGAHEWRLKAMPAPRPLYGLDKLAARPSASVLVVEGEKTADAAAERFPEHVVVTSAGGSKAAKLADWTALTGRAVTIWPDADKPGADYANEVAAGCHEASASAVRVVAIPSTFPARWDLADALPAGVTDAQLVAMLGQAAKSDDGPLPLYPELPDAEPYPVDALGPVLSRAALAIARKVQVPAAIAGQSVLAAAALAAQAHADVRLPFGQVRPLSLYLVTLAGSGDRKSSADAEALWPIRKREKALKEDHDEELKEWLIAAAAWGAQKRKIEADKKLDRHTQKDELRALGPEPERPLFPFLTAPDPTIEGLVKAWVNAPAALGIFTAEGGQFVGGHGMNPDNRLKSAAAFSELWDGRAIKRIRAGDGVSVLYGRRLSMHLMVQPDAAAGLLADPLLRDQGLLSRLLVASPASIAGTRFYQSVRPDDDAAIRACGSRILSLLEASWPMADGKRNELEPRELTMSAEAEAVWRSLFDHVEGQCGKGRDLAPVGDLAAKIAEHAARIAGILTVVDYSQADEIGADAMSNAVELADWYLAEAVRLQQAARTDPKLLRAKQMLDWMRSEGDGEIGFRQIVQFGPGPMRSKAAAEEAVATLLAHGWLVEVSKRPRRFRIVAGENGR